MTNFLSSKLLSLFFAALALVCLTGMSSSPTPLAYFDFDGDVGPGEIFTKGDAPPPQAVPGRYGMALAFGEGAVVARSLSIDPRDYPQLTITAWIRISEDAARGPYLFSPGGGTSLPELKIQNRRLAAKAGRSVESTSVDVPVDEWVKVAAVWDFSARTLRLQVGDVSELFTNLSMNVASDGIRPQRLWAHPSDPAVEDLPYVFIGARDFQRFPFPARGITIDNVQIFGEALSEGVVSALGRGGSAGGEAAIVAESGAIPAAELASASPAGIGTEIATPGSQQLATSPPALAVGGDETPTQSSIDVSRENIQDRPQLGDLLQETAEDPELETVALPPGTGVVSEEPRPTPSGESPVEEFENELADFQENISEQPRPSCPNPGSTDVLATFTGQFPPGFVTAVQRARECHNPITAIALTDSDQWVVATDQRNSHSLNLPPGMQDAIEGFEAAGRILDTVAISQTGQWLVVAGNQFEQGNLPGNAVVELQRSIAGGPGAQVVSFAFDPTSNSRWTLVRRDGIVHHSSPPPSLLAALTRLSGTQRKPHLIAFAPDGGWLMLTNDYWHVTDDIAPAVIRDLSSQRLSNHRIDHLLFYHDRTRRLRVSNGPEPARADAIWQMENSVSNSAPATPPVFADTNIWQRMQAHAVTGLTLAVIRNNTIAWARGYGLRDSRDPESVVHPDTIFDAASVSKAIAAFAVLQLVEQNRLELDEEGVLTDLRVLFPNLSSRLSFDVNVRPEESNLIQILQHCAGFNYEHGGSGTGKYALGVALPSLPETILGIGSAKSGQKILRNGTPGAAHVYSGSDYVLVQALIEVHSRSFLEHTARLFGDLDMTSSTYATPTPARNSDRYALGHNAGVPLPIVAIPEMAAGSLTTTAADLARFVIAVNRGGQSLLGSDMVDRYIGRTAEAVDYCTSPGKMALGINRSTDPAPNGQWTADRFWHDGDHEGSHAHMIGFPNEQSGLVMIVTSGGDALWQEIAFGFARAYGFCSGC